MNRFTAMDLPPDQGRTPSKTATHSLKQNQITALDTSITQGLDQGQRH
jgi:hypothetical protein